jgi:hypothetical protein
LDNDTLLVADEGNDRVQRFDLFGQPLGVLGAPIDATVVVSRPVDVAAGLDGAVYVADVGHHRVARLASDGDERGGWGGRGSGPGQFDEISALAASASGLVFALDAELDRLQAFAPSHAATWRVERYANRWLAEAPVAVSDTERVAFLWGEGEVSSDAWESPGPLSIRAVRHVAEAGPHAFTVESVGGARLWVGERLLVDRWVDIDVTDTVTHTLPTGGARVRLEFGASSRPASVRLDVEPAGGPARVMLPLAVR